MCDGWDSMDNVLSAGRDPDAPFHLTGCTIEWVGLCAACQKTIAAEASQKESEAAERDPA